MMSIKATILLVLFSGYVSYAQLKPGVPFASLSKTLVMNVTINEQLLTPNVNLTANQGTDRVGISWALNQTFAGNDTNYKQVFLKLCYGAPSAVNRPWRKNDPDLRISKTCKYGIKRFSYNSSGGSYIYYVPDNIPTGVYFVRAFVLNTTDREAVPADNAVAFGQTTDSTRTANLFHVQGYMGTNTGIVAFTIGFSVLSYATLFGYFFMERAMKKNV